MATSRSEYVVKNAGITIAMQLIRNLLGFVSRIIFINVLGVEYLGVNGLFTQILTVLSFAELGIGSAMVYSLYKPLAEKDDEKIKSLMKLYAYAYRVIGIVIAVLGILLIPFVPFIVGEVEYIKENLILLYLMFLLNTVLSYFFVYKKSLIIADQKNYVVSIYAEVFHGIQIILQCVLLYLTNSIFAYLWAMIVCTLLNNVVVALKANKMYPCLTEKNIRPLEKEERKDIIINVKSLVIYKVGNIFLESTDSIFISLLANVTTVGLYMNYKMIVDIFKSVGKQIMNSITASIGNLNNENDNEKKEKVFGELLFLSAWFYSFTAVGMGLLMTPLVKVVFGENLTITTGAVWAVCGYYYVSNMHYACYTFRTTTGLFRYGKYVPIVCGCLNIVLNIVLGIHYGLAGILWASVISRCFTFEIIDPILIYKRVFFQNPLGYFGKYAKYLLITVVCAVVSYVAISNNYINGIIGVIIKAIIVTLIYNSMFFVLNVRTAEWKAIKQRIMFLAGKWRHKND